MKLWFLLIIMATPFFPASAQMRLIPKGKIEYERKMNIHRLFFGDMQNDKWVEEAKRNAPPFASQFFELIFTEDKSLYQPVRSESARNIYEVPAGANVVYKDIRQQTGAAQKIVLSTEYLILDSLRKVEWKLQDEIRTIAGFECRKAVARICDSVVVVAFYTHEISPSAGPESFQGLPGMILGIAIPRLYTTWFATKVELIGEGEERKIIPPTKGKKFSNGDLQNTLIQLTKGYSAAPEAVRTFWWSRL